MPTASNKNGDVCHEDAKSAVDGDPPRGRATTSHIAVQNGATCSGVGSAQQNQGSVRYGTAARAATAGASGRV